jgi:hypothetical protein
MSETGTEAKKTLSNTIHMIPVYFPYTYISRPVMTALQNCFGRTVVYLPSEHMIPESMFQWSDGGLLDLRVPVKSEEDKLAAVLKSYRQWAALHDNRQGIDFSYLKAHSHDLPFFDENATSHIRSEIKGRLQGEQVNRSRLDEQTENLIHSRIFLSIAQELDLQSDLLNDDLKRFDAMERDLIQNLKGEIEPSGEDFFLKRAVKPGEQEDYMLRERLQAWTQLMQADDDQFGHEASGLLITSNRAVLEQVVEHVPVAEKIFKWEAIPVGQKMGGAMVRWRDELMAQIEFLSGSEWKSPADRPYDSPAIPSDASAERTVALTVFLVPAMQPVEVLNRIIRQDQPQTNTAPNIKNTIVGCVRP